MDLFASLLIMYFFLFCFERGIIAVEAKRLVKFQDLMIALKETLNHERKALVTKQSSVHLNDKPNKMPQNFNDSFYMYYQTTAENDLLRNSNVLLVWNETQ